jgi:hypothetical protein
MLVNLCDVQGCNHILNVDNDRFLDSHAGLGERALPGFKQQVRMVSPAANEQAASLGRRRCTKGLSPVCSPVAISR